MFNFKKYLNGKMMGILLFVSISVFAVDNYYALRSYLIMFPYSWHHNQISLLKQEDYVVKAPSNLRQIASGWYPRMLVFHDEHGFGNWLNKPLELTVLYRFGGFGFGNNHSGYYDRNSDTFSSFYGAYLVKNNDVSDGNYGYDNNNELIVSEIMNIVEYDQRWLVMPSIGLSPDRVIFEVDVVEHTTESYDISHLGHEWSKVDALIKTNSPEHHYTDQQRGYLQYGIPIAPPDGLDDFYPITLAGRIYISKSESDNVTLLLYILAADFAAVDEIDEQIVSKISISKP